MLVVASLTEQLNIEHHLYRFTTSFTLDAEDFIQHVSKKIRMACEGPGGAVFVAVLIDVSGGTLRPN
jgi:hypothetical protein